MTPRAFSAGTTLYIEGARAERLWYLLDGTVGLLRDVGDRRGAGVPWTTRRGGSIIGNEALVQGEYADTAIALTDVTVCGSESNCFEKWLRAGNGDAAHAILQLVIRAHCEAGPRPSTSEGSATCRVARWLADESRGGVAPPIPRAVVAGLLGMLPETFSRALSTLASRGAIEVDRKQIRVIDANVLLAEAGEG
jgi:CRP-like cAMP-binding protein